jgi:hypothetical protein
MNQERAKSSGSQMPNQIMLIYTPKRLGKQSVSALQPFIFGSLGVSGSQPKTVRSETELHLLAVY